MSLPPTVTGLLRTHLQTWQRLTDQIHALTAERDEIRAQCGGLLTQVGYATVSLDGYTIAQVPPTTVRSVKPDKLLLLGVTAATIAAATVETTRRGYVSILAPGKTVP
jgi:hypothetical protein